MRSTLLQSWDCEVRWENRTPKSTALVVPRHMCFGDAQRTDCLCSREGVRRSGWALAGSLQTGGADPEPALAVFLLAAPRHPPCKTEHYSHLVSGDWEMAMLDIEVVLFTSAFHNPITQEGHCLEASLIAYLGEPGCRSVGDPAAGALAADNPAQVLGSPEAPAASWHTGGSWGRVGVTWMTLGEPRSLFSP